jgi:hypothetical protein
LADEGKMTPRAAGNIFLCILILIAFAYSFWINSGH